MRATGLGEFAQRRAGKKVADVVTYRDQNGKPSRDVIRFVDGSRSQRSYLPNGDTVNNVKSAPLLPYRLAEMLAAIERGETIWVAEGQKDVETLASQGLTATTSPQGRNQTWPPGDADRAGPPLDVNGLPPQDQVKNS